jgi:AcrR family transcriptional regulator
VEKTIARYSLHVEKPVPERLIEAAIGLLGTDGAGAVTVRAVEAAAGTPHGSVRHHFGSLAGLRQALVRGLLLGERADSQDASLPDLVTRWTGAGAPIARARYEVMLMAMRDPALREVFVNARDDLVARLASTGVPPSEAPALVAMLDGIVLDALLRGTRPNLAPWQRALSGSAGPGSLPE